MEAIERAELCLLEAKSLYDSVLKYHNAFSISERVIGGYETEKNGQANKTAIKRQIVSMRQSLLALDRDLECYPT